PFTVNAGGTFDLNGHSETVGNFSSVGTLPGTGGTVTNSSTTTATFTMAANSVTQDWAGQITGNASNVINVVKTGATLENFHDNNTYFGATTVMGNVLSLVD